MIAKVPPPKVSVTRRRVRDGSISGGERIVAEETAVALAYDGAAEVVMMATPADLEDFAVGFSLTEGIVASPREIAEIEIAPQQDGIVLRIWLTAERRDGMERRRRKRAGPVGCGLCGIESLADAARSLPKIKSALRIDAAEIVTAMRALSEKQTLNKAAHAVHAAGFYMPGEGIVAVREDVGRHCALDKLAGALAREGRKPSTGAILLTSRVSVEMVQKAAMIGAPVIAAVSAPTALALRTAETAGITVAGIVRDDGLEIFTCPERILASELHHAD